MNELGSKASVSIVFPPEVIVPVRAMTAIALFFGFILMLIVSGLPSIPLGMLLIGGYLYSTRFSRAGGYFAMDSVTVRSPLFDRKIAVADIARIAFSGEPRLLRVITQDGGFTTVQVGRNMFEGRGLRENRLAQLKAIARLYADLDVTVDDDVASAGFGWTRRSPMLRRELVRFGVCDTIVIAGIAVLTAFRVFG